MHKKQMHAGHRKRVKEEFRKLGLGHFPPHKVLEMLLFYSIPQGDTNEIGHRLMESFGSLPDVLDAPIELLVRTPGIGPESATYIRILGDVIGRYTQEKSRPPKAIRNISQAKDFMRHKFFGESAECVYLACLGSNGKVLYSEKVSRGTGQNVNIMPGEIVRVAVICSAVKIILAHNHPNGICNPSREDLHTTKLICDQVRHVNIELMDHIIVAPDGVCSMAESNMLPGW